MIVEALFYDFSFDARAFIELCFESILSFMAKISSNALKNHLTCFEEIVKIYKLNSTLLLPQILETIQFEMWLMLVYMCAPSCPT